MGERTRILIEGASRRGGGQLYGRCPYNRVVNFTPDAPLAPGSFAEVEIRAASPHSLVGEPIRATVPRELPLL